MVVAITTLRTGCTKTTTPSEHNPASASLLNLFPTTKSQKLKIAQKSSTYAMESQCETLISLLSVEQVLLPGSAEYSVSLLSYFSPHASAVKPLCFVLPKTAEDVSTIITSLVASSCKFAVRGGGHMWFPGASSSVSNVMSTPRSSRSKSSQRFSSDT